MRHWRRASGWTTREIVSALLVAWGAAFMGGVTVMLVVHGIMWQARALPGLLGMYALLGGWLTFAWRQMRTGVYTSESGIRVRWLLRTRTYSWSRIDAVDAAPARLLDMPTSRAAIWLDLGNGERVETPVQRRVDAALGSIVFTKDVGPVLRRDKFDRLLQELDQRCRKSATSTNFSV